ncbi:RNA polymerase [Streptomyces toyocaensis]|uniref:RNA polymerase n=1 Tax=Streptomyces toyocaensis TaxID=55952 RepID=A0A081XHV0_STRTO|nr:sigma-70 family RNA polymerase sigma factor [Streptomyces toyocaensis]KES03123.1 RNA polymerase [Streptomyces toyocaensis]
MTGTTKTEGVSLAPSPISTRRCAPHDDHHALIQTIYDRHGPLLLRYAARLLGGDWHKAEDILQETAARAWKHATFLRSHSEHLRPWLFTVVRNLVTDHHRACGLRPLELVPIEDLDTTWESSDHALTLHVVLNALQDLNEQQRTVIRLLYCLECSVAQTAEHLGIPPGTVKSRAFYALRALRKVLEGRGMTEA